MEIIRPKSKQPIPDHAKKVFKGVVFDVYQWEQEMFDGSKAIFEKVKRPDSVSIYPITSEGKILLVKEEQPGRDPFISPPAGRIEDGEDVLVSAKRELLEETGLASNEFILWKAIYPSSQIDWVVYMFIAKDLSKASDQNLDAGEKIELKEYNFFDFLNIVEDDSFRDYSMKEFIHEAKIYPEKMEELRKLFSVKN